MEIYYNKELIGVDFIEDLAKKWRGLILVNGEAEHCKFQEPPTTEMVLKEIEIRKANKIIQEQRQLEESIEYKLAQKDVEIESLKIELIKKEAEILTLKKRKVNEFRPQ